MWTWLTEIHETQWQLPSFITRAHEDWIPTLTGQLTACLSFKSLNPVKSKASLPYRLNFDLKIVLFRRITNESK